MKNEKSKIWIFSSKIDIICLGIPIWICWLICFILPQNFHQATFPLWVWVVTVLAIDVGHVWSTIYRTYLDKEEFGNHRDLLTYGPIISFFILFCLAIFSFSFFWRAMAYLALFHFIKQQVGFWAIYNAKLNFPKIRKWLKDKWVIYISMLYPVVFWHLDHNRNFSWFLDGDFISIPQFIDHEVLETIFDICNYLYWVIMIAWLVQEVLISVRHKLRIPYGKLIWVLTTAGNWYLGIVYFNSDIAFTITNVVAHGIPYLTLVFYYVIKKRALKTKKEKFKGVTNNYRTIIYMFLGIFLLAFFEEYFWDMLLNRNKSAFFESILQYPINQISNEWIQALGLALLSLPQVAHYIIDGFIWKGNKSNPYLKKVLS